MDPNLYVRFMIPAWVGAIGALVANWAVGGRWLGQIVGADEGQAWTAVIVALLGSPAAGFVLNTVIVAICRWVGTGPEYSDVFASFKQQVLNACSGMDKSLCEAIRVAEPVQLIAHFEYRTDTPELLAWRRRQRMAFYVNWSSILALIVGAIIGTASESPSLVKAAVVFLLLLLFIGMLASNARNSLVNDSAHQRIWAASWSDSQIELFLREYGTGFSQRPHADNSDSPPA